MEMPDDLVPADGQAVVIIRSGDEITHAVGLLTQYGFGRSGGGLCTCAPRRDAEVSAEMDDFSIPRPRSMTVDVSIKVLPDGLRQQHVKTFERELRGIPLPTMSGDSVPAPERVAVGVPQPA